MEYEETCTRHGQNMATKMCYGVDYFQYELSRIASAFERMADALENKSSDCPIIRDHEWNDACPEAKCAKCGIAFKDLPEQE